MNILDYKIDNMIIKEMLKTFGIVMACLVGFGIFFLLTSPLIWLVSNGSILFELWKYMPVYFLIIFCGWIIHYALTPQHNLDDVMGDK